MSHKTRTFHAWQRERFGLQRLQLSMCLGAAYTHSVMQNNQMWHKNRRASRASLFMTQNPPTVRTTRLLTTQQTHSTVQQANQQQKAHAQPSKPKGATRQSATTLVARFHSRAACALLLLNIRFTKARLMRAPHIRLNRHPDRGWLAIAQCEYCNSLAFIFLGASSSIGDLNHLFHLLLSHCIQ